MISIAICWSSPYTQPPENRPRVLQKFHFSDCDLRANRQLILDSLYVLLSSSGPGYNLGWTFYDDKPRRQWSLEAKQKVRRSRLRNRLQTKYPLFADSFYQETVTKKPGYYGSDVEVSK